MQTKVNPKGNAARVSEKEAFALTHQTATGRNKAGAVFLCLAISVAGKRFANSGLREGVESSSQHPTFSLNLMPQAHRDAVVLRHAGPDPASSHDASAP
ncbi:hypothetical protein [Rhizobium sp. GR12]|uniref:hypothetical protein n=1 Tax=Rhizobium sp. GR12 TaxID=3053925 RepID=UPI002FBE6A9E